MLQNISIIAQSSMRSAEKQLGTWKALSEIKTVKNSIRSRKIKIRKFKRRTKYKGGGKNYMSPGGPKPN